MSLKKGFMKKVKTVLFTLLFVLGVFGVILATMRFKNHAELKSLKNEVGSIRKLERISKKLLAKWTLGANDEEWKIAQKSCLDLKIKDGVDSTYSRCNALYFNCYLKDQDYELKEYEKGKFYKIISRQTSLESNIPHFAVRVSLKLSNKYYDLDFEDSCRDVYLPQKNYGYKTKKTTRNKFLWTWDNMNKNIFLDKFLVSNREVNEWIETTKQDIEKKFPLERPASSLTKKEMKKYCEFKGKTLASAKVVEAATFYPSAGSDLPGGLLLKYDYPWTRRKKDSFLYQLSEGKEIELTKDHCERTYVRDCFELTPYVNNKTSSSSWAGIFQTLGGVFETYDNTIESQRNMRASSFYFDARNKVHRVGEKIYWDGLANLDKNIEWGDHKPDGVSGRSLEIGFRCMKYVQN
ncbi:hypothetical protein [Halobacteriovorax sp. HLS]|uniref:hypothetical protein n=1 Tax=Halobacteriovorax sp. HLS TaxID=2234000 RepID=UPI000FDA7DF6|nr:hypothetical protein [Halobacteriovorax sp. HLS]